MPRDQLTGGTRDVNPQWMRGYVTTSGTSQLVAQSTVRLPIQRLPSGKKCQVIEILKVQYLDAEATSSAHITCGVTTQTATSSPPLNDPAAIHICRFPSDGTGPKTQLFDLTDAAGHGVLVATDNIFMWAAISSTDVHHIYFSILYRFKNVTMAEYVGISQSQMNLV